jgi:hypothetical protein
MTARMPLTTAMGVAALSCLLAACGAGAGAAGPGPGGTAKPTGAPQVPPSGQVKPAQCPSHASSGGASGIVPVSGLGNMSVPFVPPGPRWATVCRYAGLNWRVPAGTLERSRVVSGPALAQLVSLADHAVPVARRSYNCPMSQGLFDLLFFVYPDGKTVTVTVALDGCVFAHNADRTVWAGSIAALLKSWVGQDAGP